MDLTTLSGDDTVARVRRLCSKARQPISLDLEKELGVQSLNLSVAAVCVYHDMLVAAKNAIQGTQLTLLLYLLDFLLDSLLFQLDCKKLNILLMLVQMK